MTTLYAAVSPLGKIDFHTISLTRFGCLAPSDVKYGGLEVRQVSMRPFKGEVSTLLQGVEDPWSTHGLAWVWRNHDNSYWMDTLSLTEGEATAWASNRARNEAMGMKVIPVQIICKMSAKEKTASVQNRIAVAKSLGDVLGEATWAKHAADV